MPTQPLDQGARLALAARAEVAVNLSEAVKERNAASAERGAPLAAAMLRFKELHGHDFDPRSRRDSAMLLPLLDATGAGRMTWEDLEAGLAAEAEVLEYQELAIRAVKALVDAWQPVPGQTLLQWIGCEPEELRAAVDLERAIWEETLAALSRKLASGTFWRCWSCRAMFATTQRPKPASGRCHRCSAGTGRTDS